MDLLKKIDKILENKIVDRHSYFQLKHFVIGREYSDQGKMWKCLKEIRTRKLSIDTFKSEIREASDNIKLLQIDNKRNKHLLKEVIAASNQPKDLKELDEREVKIKLRKNRRKIRSLKEKIVSLKIQIKDYLDEANFFVSQFEHLNKEHALKEFDDVEAQKEYWNNKLFSEINVKLLLRQPLDPEVVKLVFSLNDEATVKQQLIKLLEFNNRASVGKEIDG